MVKHFRMSCVTSKAPYRVGTGQDHEKWGCHEGTPFVHPSCALQKSRNCRTGRVLRRDQHGVDDVDDSIGALNIGLGHGRVVDSHRCLGIDLDV